MFLITFSYNHAIILLYKYLCLSFNKSVFNWTICQLLHLRKTQLHENSYSLDTNVRLGCKCLLDTRTAVTKENVL
jgi:hypothetical protein